MNLNSPVQLKKIETCSDEAGIRMCIMIARAARNAGTSVDSKNWLFLSSWLKMWPHPLNSFPEKLAAIMCKNINMQNIYNIQTPQLTLKHPSSYDDDAYVYASFSSFSVSTLSRPIPDHSLVFFVSSSFSVSHMPMHSHLLIFAVV